MKITASQIAKLREATGAPIVKVKEVLELTKGNEAKAESILKEEGFKKVAKRAERETAQGKVFVYAHHSGKVASMVELLCETDFVARNELFESLGKDLAMQVASMDPKDADELTGQEFIKDPSKKIADLVKEVIAKTGENIRIGRLSRTSIGES